MTVRRSSAPPSPPRRPPGAAPLAAGLAAAGVLLAALLCLAVLTPRPTGREPGIGGPFTLIRGDGKTVTERDFPGKYLLVYFGYTACRDTCPATLNTLAAAIDQLGPRANQLQPLFITIDPLRDTPAVVEHYASGFSPRLIGLSGQPAELRRVAAEYSVSSILHRDSPNAADYALDHSAVIYLMAPNGSFITPIRADATPPEMSKAIADHIS